MDQTEEPDLYLVDCCFGDSGTPGVDCDCVWTNTTVGQQPSEESPT